MKVSIIGGGLAGSEAAWQLANRGIEVEIFEMRPKVKTNAHKTSMLAELVCSNSFRGAELSSAVGVLKEELRLLNSLIMTAAEHAKVPAGGALAVDRDVFSEFVSNTLENHPKISIKREEVQLVPEANSSHVIIIASGPLTSKALSKAILEFSENEHLSFYDAISPIILSSSIDMTKVFRQSRYEKGNGDDYLNIPLSKELYYEFVENVLQAEKYTGKEEIENNENDFDLRPFEGCMPIEDMAERGIETLRFGPLKAVGLYDPNSEVKPYAVIQLRQDDKSGSLWSMVGMQTRMKQGEQLRIFKSLPGLESAEFIRLGSVHRNTFLNSPEFLLPTLQTRKNPYLFFAGQITGVEGYVESTSGGALAGINSYRILKGLAPISFPKNTCIGALHSYISESGKKDFQPMNVSFGLIEGYESIPLKKIKAPKHERKKQRKILAAEIALNTFRDFIDSNLD